MIKIDKGLVRSIASCQIDIKIVNSKKCNSIYSKSTRPSIERREIKKRQRDEIKQNLFRVQYSILYTIFSVVRFYRRRMY